MNKNKNKGKVFERFVADKLSSIFGLSFTRTPSSGAFVGGSNSFRLKTLSDEQVSLFDGDIIIPKELLPFSFECKWYKDFSWNELLCTGGNSFITKWIEQASQTKKPFWFIIFKINRQGEFVCFPNKYLWEEELHLAGNNIMFSKDNSICYVVTPMEGFFEKNKEVMFELGRKYNEPDKWNQQSK